MESTVFASMGVCVQQVQETVVNTARRAKNKIIIINTHRKSVESFFCFWFLVFVILFVRFCVGRGIPNSIFSRRRRCMCAANGIFVVMLCMVCAVPSPLFFLHSSWPVYRATHIHNERGHDSLTSKYINTFCTIKRSNLMSGFCSCRRRRRRRRRPLRHNFPFSVARKQNELRYNVNCFSRQHCDGLPFGPHRPTHKNFSNAILRRNRTVLQY